MQKPVAELTKLERLAEIVALQRLRAREGMQGSNRTNLEFLRERSATGPLIHTFGGDWDKLVQWYLTNAGQEYDKLKTYADGTERGRDLFMLLIREKGLTNVAAYRVEKQKIARV